MQLNFYICFLSFKNLNSRDNFDIIHLATMGCSSPIASKASAKNFGSSSFMPSTDCAFSPFDFLSFLGEFSEPVFSTR